IECSAMPATLPPRRGTRQDQPRRDTEAHSRAIQDRGLCAPPWPLWFHGTIMSVTLPIEPLLPEVVAALRQHNRLVLRAAPGAGKTTRVPAALLDAGLAGAKQVVVLEPRRIAAR